MEIKSCFHGISFTAPFKIYSLMDKRLEYFDFLRGLAILMVVAIHTFSSSVDSSIVMRQIFNIAVPIFLAISGFFLANKDLSTWNTYFIFLRKQFPRVYIPCMLWSLPLFISAIFAGGSILKNTVYLLICGFSIYYFIALIMQYYILLPVVQKKCGSKKGVCISACISTISITFITYIMHVKGLYMPLIVYAGFFPLWLVFFSIGVYIAQKGNRNYSIFWPCVYTLIFLLVSYFESKFLVSFHGGGVGIKLSSFAYSFLGIIVLFSCQFEKIVQYLKWLYKLGSHIGKYSFGIYLSHCYFIHLYGSICSDWSSLSWLSKWFIVSISSYAFIYVGNFLMPKLSKYLGFK